MKEIIRNISMKYLDISLKLFSFHVFEEDYQNFTFVAKSFLLPHDSKTKIKRKCVRRDVKKTLLCQKGSMSAQKRIAVQLCIHYSGYTVTKVYEIINKGYWWLWW